MILQTILSDAITISMRQVCHAGLSYMYGNTVTVIVFIQVLGRRFAAALLPRLFVKIPVLRAKARIPKLRAAAAEPPPGCGLKTLIFSSKNTIFSSLRAVQKNQRQLFLIPTT